MKESIILKRFDQMRRRWPEIGQSADLPLTLFFMKRRKPMKGRRTSSFSMGVSQVILLVFLLFLLGPLGLLLAAIFFRQLFFAEEQRLVGPVALFSKVHKDKLIDVWLTPLSFKELWATEAARVYCHGHWLGTVARFALWIALPVWIIWLNVYPIRGISLETSFLAFSLFALWTAFFFLITSKEAHVGHALSMMRMAVERRQPDRIRRGIDRVLINGCLTFITLVGAIMAIVLASIFLKDFVVSWGLVFTVAAGILLWVRFAFLRRWIQWRFTSQVEEYEQLYANLIYSESDK